MSIVETGLKRAKQQHQQPPGLVGPLLHRRSSDPTARPVSIELQRLDPDPSAIQDYRILIGHNPGLAAASDAYRILRTRLSSRLTTHGWNSLAVTSAGPGDGKSVTVLNLGLAFASERKRNIFLLDLDLRKPSLCQYLGVQPRSGIGQYLGGEAELPSIFFSIGVDNLVLAGGLTHYQHSAELLGGERMGQLLTHIANLDPNALIIADLPPLLSVADALVVAPQLSSTLLVVAEGGTRREGLARAREVLAGMPLAGIVLNHSTEAVNHYYG